MSQAWLQVAGLFVELAGVLLLAWEWFAGRRQERRERALEAEQARREEAQAMLQRHHAASEPMQRHFEMTRDMGRRMTATRVGETRAHYGGMRGWAVGIALVCVIIGFVLQLAGTWPGCCGALGITPGA